MLIIYHDAYEYSAGTSICQHFGSCVVRSRLIHPSPNASNDEQSWTCNDCIVIGLHLDQNFALSQDHLDHLDHLDHSDHVTTVHCTVALELSIAGSAYLLNYVQSPLIYLQEGL